MKTDTLTMVEKFELERLKMAIDDGLVDDGIPRTQVKRNEDGTYTASLKGFQPAVGSSVVDALSALHDSLLTYWKRLSDPKMQLGEHSQNQLATLEAFMMIHNCDCGRSPDSYCYCRGFKTS